MSQNHTTLRVLGACLVIAVGAFIARYYFCERKTMNQKLAAPAQPVSWIVRLDGLTKAKPSGTFTAKDKLGKPVILEWQKLTMKSPDFSKVMREVCDLACAAYTPVEVAFLKAFTDQAVPATPFDPASSFAEATEDRHGEREGTKVREGYCAPFEALFEKGSPQDQSDWKKFKQALEKKDWPKVEARMPLLIKQIYIMDYAAYASIGIGVANIHFVVTAKDGKTGALLGFVEFFVTPAYPSGDIKSPSFAVAPAAQNRGLGKLLMSTIFKIVTDACTRIFLSTRITNDVARQAYTAWGFTPDANPIQEPFYKQNPEHWMFFEYKVDSCSKLQEAAKCLVEVQG
jgi:GNAT superfamily N-acetyltransferase